MLGSYANRLLRRLRRFTACEAGTQLAELAVVLPVLLVLFGATAEFGRFFYTYNTLSGLTPGNVQITREEPTPGFPVTVTVEISGYTYEPIFDLGKLMGNNFSLRVDVKPSTTMRYVNN
jgi:hypothetical protein